MVGLVRVWETCGAVRWGTMRRASMLAGKTIYVDFVGYADVGHSWRSGV